MEMFDKPGVWLKGNLHCHTTASDGVCTPQQTCRLYRDAGYDFLALTDCRRFYEPTGHEPLTVLSGGEWTVCVGGTSASVVGVGMRRAPEISPAEAPTAKEVIAAIRAAGGLAVWAQPGQLLVAPEDILKEIRTLVADGVKEIMLLGQNVNSYGKNLEEPITFAQLLTEVEKIDGLERIRFMTSHPKDLSDELIQVMKHSKKICRHLHLPLQSGSTEILRRMNRRYTKEQYLALAEKLRREIPDLSLTTDIIVGFPGETEEDFQETLDVVRKVRYDSAFTFIYSKRTGTPAAAMENQIPEDVVKDRFNRLLTLVQDISREQSLRVQGQTLPVLVESVNEQDSHLVTGRLSNNLLVHFPGDASMIGEIVPVYLKECMGFYYYGERVEA